MRKIICINKDNGDHINPHEAVSHYGWVADGESQAYKSTRISMVNWVKNGGTAYVQDTQGNIAVCFVNQSVRGTEFLQTKSDGKLTDNILYLPECS